jgi:hypothetical protein
MIEKPDDLQRLEDKAAPLIEDPLAIPDFAVNPDRPDLAASDAGIAGILGHAQTALDAAGLRSADVAGDTLDLGIVKAVDDDFVVWSEEPEFCANRAGRAALRATKDPSPKHDHYQQDDAARYQAEFPHDHLVFPTFISRLDLCRKGRGRCGHRSGILALAAARAQAAGVMR